MVHELPFWRKSAESGWEGLKTIYVLLMRSQTPLSRVIYQLTRDAYTHVSFSFEPSLQPLYSSARKNGETIVPAGPCIERLRHGYYGRHPGIPCRLFELQVPDEVFEAAKARAEYFIANARRYHFNFWGMALCRFGIAYRRPHHFFCSQFAAEVLGDTGALRLPKPKDLMRPVDYDGLPELTCVFTGTLGRLVEQYQSGARETRPAAKSI